MARGVRGGRRHVGRAGHKMLKEAATVHMGRHKPGGAAAAARRHDDKTSSPTRATRAMANMFPGEKASRGYRRKFGKGGRLATVRGGKRRKK